MSEEERFRDERQRSISRAIEQTEAARASAQESARRFREVEAGRPFGPVPSQAPEARKNIRVRPETLERVPPAEPLPKSQRTRTLFRTRTVKAKAPMQRQSSRRGTFGFSFRGKRVGGRPPNLPDSPANIDPEEKKRALERIDLALAKENRKYATQIVHGGTDPRKLQTRQRIQQLENEKRAIQNMKPTGRWRFSLFAGLQKIGNLPGHVREAERD